MTSNSSRRPNLVIHKPTKKTEFSLKKKLGFTCVSICLFFLILELLLAMSGVETSLERDDPYVGFEASIPLFVEQADADGRFLQTAPNKLTYFNPQRFPKDKPPGTFRIFCLGGSTTFGRPYDDSTSFCAWLRELLAAADKDRNYEVINAGGISYASYRVAAVMEELNQYDPDLFIVYCGHNEFLEERTYGELRESSESTRLMSLLLHRTRTLRVAKELLSSSEPTDDERFMLPGEVDAILDHTAGPISYHRDDQLREQILEHFKLNLTRMTQTAKEAEAELVFVTPAANIKDFSPFKSELSPELSQAQQLQWTASVSQAAEREEHGDLRGAIEQLEAAVAIDARHAEVRYQLGRLLFLQQSFAEAEREFQAALDNDICPLRAVSQIRQIVREVAANRHVPLVDFEEILRKETERTNGHGIPGNEFILDHVHPTIEGHRLLAMALVEAMIQMDITTPDNRWRDHAVASATREIESRMDPEANAKALTNLSQVLNWAGKREEAGRLAIAAVDLREDYQLEDDPESLFYAAISLETAGDTARAKEFFEKVLQLQPDIHQARWHLSQLLIEEGAFQNAKRELERLIDADPGLSRYLQSLGRVLLELKQFEAALNTFEQAKTADPELLGLQEDMAYAHELLKNRAD